MGKIHYVVPAELVGRGIPSDNLQRGLQELNPDIAFDVGGRKNLWHPDMEFAQGVYHNERHICTMDRGVCPEFSVWTTKEDWIEVPWGEVIPGETTFVGGENGLPMAKRAQQDKCIQVGWRYTLRAVIRANISGCSKEAVEAKFGVSIDLDGISDDEIAVVEERADRVVDKQIVLQSAEA